MLGVVGLYLLENLVFRRPGSGRHQHVTMGWASLLGLTVHAFTAGLALAGASEQAHLAWPVYCSIVSHKVTETFSLATVFMLAGYGIARVLAIVAAFSLVTPAGVLCGQVWVADLDAFGVQVLVALAAGTFLFVALCDLLPEVFHHREDALAKVGLLAAGVAATYLMHAVGS
jgi:zinc transporter ZupT